MKLVKILILLAVFTTLPFAYAGAIDKNPSTVNDLDIQIYKEIKDVLNEPVFLSYTDKNLKGDAIVTIYVQENGKIVVRDVKGTNSILNEYLMKKVKTRNMWTDTSFANSVFTYKVKSI